MHSSPCQSVYPIEQLVLLFITSDLEATKFSNNLYRESFQTNELRIATLFLKT